MGLRSVDRTVNSVLGAFAADAATMGLHWIYDLPHLHKLAQQGEFFREPEAANYKGVSAYFAHAGKRAGQGSHYGEAMMFALRTLTAQQGFQLQSYQSAWYETFRAGGRFVGYADKPTRKTLAQLEAAMAKAQDQGLKAHGLDASGADDDQIPAVNGVNALLLAHPEDWTEHLEALLRVTHNNDLAVASARAVAQFLSTLQSGASLDEGLKVLTENSPGRVQDGLNKALAMTEDFSLASVQAAAKALGPACPLVSTVPLSAWVLKRAQSFREATRMNLLAGGDSCGRAMIVGAAAGALFGLSGERGLPLSWLQRLADGPEILDCVESLSQ